MTLADLIGIPYEKNGRTLKGADCFGLCRLARKYLEGRDDIPAYITPEKFREIEKAVKEERDLNWQRIEPGRERSGDWVLLKKRGFAMHCGYVTEPGWMLHTEEGIDSVHVRYGTLEHPWEKIEGFYRYGRINSH